MHRGEAVEAPRRASCAEALVHRHVIEPVERLRYEHDHLGHDGDRLLTVGLPHYHRLKNGAWSIPELWG